MNSFVALQIGAKQRCPRKLLPLSNREASHCCLITSFHKIVDKTRIERRGAKTKPVPIACSPICKNLTNHYRIVCEN